MKNMVVCTERRCGWRGHANELLESPSPFDSHEILYGCPRCRTVGSCVVACEEEGCAKEATCGWPHKDGYRVTCSEHRKESE